jgi:phage-related minor tail protein
MANEYLVSLVINAKDNASQTLGKVGAALGGATAAAGLAAGAAFGAVGVKSLQMAGQVESASASMAASMGLAEGEAEKFEGIMTDIYANNFGENFEDIAESISLVERNMKNLPQDSIQGITEEALALRDVFGKDVQETTAAAATLMEEFGLSGEEAMDVIAAGLEGGLDKQGDFLDSIGEYSNLFSENGASVEEFFSLMETGMAGGALGTDKAADAFKEFGIRLQEESESGVAALNSLGLNADAMYAGLRDGSVTSAEAFQQVLGALASVEDPLERNRLGTELLGTQWEDMGASAVLGIDMAATKMGDLEGAADGLNAKYDNLGDAFTGLGRQMEVALLPIGEILLGLINDNMPAIEAAVAWFTDTGAPAIEAFATSAVAWIQNLITQAGPIIDGFAAKWDTTLGPALLLIENAFTRITTAMGLTGDSMTVTDGILMALKGTLDAAVIGLQAVAVIAQGVAWGVEKISEAIQIAIGLFNQLGDIMELAGDKIPDWMKPGSPPPLYHALNDISGALRGMPDVGEAMGLGGVGAPAMAGAGGGGGGPMAIQVSIGSVTEGDAFNAGQKAGAGIAAELRRQGAIL